MIRTSKRMWLCGLLVLLNVLFIWGNSILTREVSAAISQFVGRLLSGFFTGPTTPAEGEGHGILRKLAHVTEFCSLGVLLSWGVRMLREKPLEWYVLPLLLGAAVAGVDEIIQIFSPGRGPHIRDVGIDSIGVVLGIFIFTLIYTLFHKQKASS